MAMMEDSGRLILCGTFMLCNL